jgi:hypothetical protein
MTFIALARSVRSQVATWTPLNGFSPNVVADYTWRATRIDFVSSSISCGCRDKQQHARSYVTWHVTTATVRSDSCVQEYKAQSVENCNFMWLLNGFESWRLIKHRLTVFGNGAVRKVFDVRGRLEKTAQQGASWSVLVTFSDEIEQDVMGGAWREQGGNMRTGIWWGNL